MPSHEDGSTDDIENSELELSAEETDMDGIKFQSGHFEKGSSSEEEAELEPISSKLISHSDESGSEFEIIDGQDVDNIAWKITDIWTVKLLLCRIELNEEMISNTF